MRINKGFGLIEVLVASVILVTLLAAILPLFDAGQHQLKKAEQVEQTLSAKKRIYQRLTEVNPVESSQGEGTDGDFLYRWDAKQLSEFRRQYAPDSLISYQLATYQISVTLLEKTGNKTVDSFSFKLIGWKE